MKTGLLTLAIFVFFGALGYYSIVTKNMENEKLITDLRAELTHSLNKGTELSTVSAYQKLIAAIPDDYDLLVEYITYCNENGFVKQYVEGCNRAMSLNPNEDFAPNLLLDYMIMKRDANLYSFIKQCLNTLPDEKSEYIRSVYNSIKGDYQVIGDAFSEVMPFSATDYTYGEKYTVIDNDINSEDNSGATKGDFTVSVVNSQGKIVKSFGEYPMSYSPAGRSFAITDDTGVPAYFNTDGRKVYIPYDETDEKPIPFKYLGEFSESVSNAENENGKWGWLNSSIRMVKAEFDYTSPFLNGVAYGRTGNEYTFVNKKLEVLLSGAFDGVMEDNYGFCTSGNVIYLKKANKYEMYNIKTNSEGNMVIETTGVSFDDVKPFGKDLGAVCINDKWGFVNKNGETIVECQFDDAYSFGAGLAPVESGGFWGYIDKEYDIKKTSSAAEAFVIEPSFDAAYPFNTCGVAPVKTGSMWIFIRLAEYASAS